MAAADAMLKTKRAPRQEIAHSKAAKLADAQKRALRVQPRHARA
jgi:hypothetical protein